MNTSFFKFFDEGLYTPFHNPSLVIALYTPYLVGMYLVGTGLVSLHDLLRLSIIPFIFYKITLCSIAIIKQYNYSVGTKIQANKAVKSNYKAILGITMFSLISVPASLMLFIVPGIYLFTRLSFALPIALLHNKNTVESIKTSVRLSAGNEGLLFKVMLEAIVLGVFTIIGMISAILVSISFPIISIVGIVCLTYVFAIIELAFISAVTEVLVSVSNP